MVVGNVLRRLRVGLTASSGTFHAGDGASDQQPDIGGTEVRKI